MKVGAQYLNVSFNEMVTDTQDALDDSGANPRKIVNILLQHDAQFSYVPSEFFDSLNTAADILDLFAKLAVYWDHFNYYLLEKLILLPSTKRLFAENLKKVYDDLRQRITVYGEQMEYFRKHTSIEVYCKAIRHRAPKDVPANFKELIKECNLNTLQEVEEFRQEKAYEYRLCKFLVLWKEIKIGSVIITLWIPKGAKPFVLPSKVEVFCGDDVKIIDGAQVSVVFDEDV